MAIRSESRNLATHSEANLRAAETSYTSPILNPRTFRCGGLFVQPKKSDGQRKTLKNSIISDATHTFAPPHAIPARYLLFHTTKINKISHYTLYRV